MLAHNALLVAVCIVPLAVTVVPREALLGLRNVQAAVRGALWREGGREGERERGKRR
jgi:hypothetical protein